MVQTIFAISQMTQLKVFKYKSKTRYLCIGVVTPLLLLHLVALSVAIAVGLCVQ